MAEDGSPPPAVGSRLIPRLRSAPSSTGALELGLFEPVGVGFHADQPGQSQQGDVVGDLERQDGGDRIGIR